MGIIYLTPHKKLQNKDKASNLQHFIKFIALNFHVLPKVAKPFVVKGFHRKFVVLSI